MVWNVFAWWFNAQDRMRERELYKELHKALYEDGYKHQISLYGTTAVPYDGKHVKARIEICSKTLFTRDEILKLYEIFAHFQPDREYSLFVMVNGQLKELKAR